MIKETLGYILAIAGLITLSLSFPNIQQMIGVTISENISSLTLQAISLVLIVLGVIFSYQKGEIGSHKSQEVPIYQGKKIIGYRRS